MANKQTYEFNKNLKDLTVVDLKAKIQEDQLRLKKLEFAHAISPLENPMNIPLSSHSLILFFIVVLTCLTITIP